MPALGIIGAIGGIASAGAGIASAVSASKARKDAEKRARGLSDLGGYSPEEVFGETPEFNFEDYETLESKDSGYGGLVGRILAGNQTNLPAASALSGDINKKISEATRQRIEGWDPSFMGALTTLQKTRNQTLKGRLPYEDALAISADRGRLANDLGVGTSGPQIAADLGLKRLDLMTNTGPNLTASIVNILQGVDPIQRHTTPAEFLLNPQQTLPYAIQDNQFGAQFNMTGQLTQAYLDAAPDPAAQGMFNLAAFQAGMGGSGSGGGQVAGAAGNALQALGQINWGSLFGGAGGAQQAPQQTYIGNGGYVPYNNANSYNPGGAASVPWAMGA